MSECFPISVSFRLPFKHASFPIYTDTKLLFGPFSPVSLASNNTSLFNLVWRKERVTLLLPLSSLLVQMNAMRIAYGPSVGVYKSQGQRWSRAITSDNSLDPLDIIKKIRGEEKASYQRRKKTKTTASTNRTSAMTPEPVFLRSRRATTTLTVLRS